MQSARLSGRYGGVLKDVRSDDMAALCIAEIAKRNNLDPSKVEDVILGCSNQAGDDNRNVGRMALLLAGFPVEVAGQTINRLCGSALNAINSAAQAIKVGEGDVFIAGGTESMTRSPFVFGKADTAFPRDVNVFDSTIGWRFVNPKMKEKYGTLGMGETAEKVAEKYGITRQEQDEFALKTQQKWGAAFAAGNSRMKWCMCRPKAQRKAKSSSSTGMSIRARMSRWTAGKTAAGLQKRRNRHGRKCERRQ